MDIELEGYQIGNISLINPFKLQFIYKNYALYWLREKHHIQIFTMGTWMFILRKPRRGSTLFPDIGHLRLQITNITL